MTTSTAPLDAAELAQALKPFGESTMLPAAAYTDPAVHAWERRHAVAAGWVCLGREDELVTGTATHQAITVGDVPVVLTRDQDGVLRAFANTCRHRGHELLPDGCSSTTRSMTCPYHAWAFRLDGTLIGAPYMAAPGATSALRPDEHRLGSIRLEEWEGFVFVTLM